MPTIDQCHLDDIVCREEANYQYKRDKAVDNRILNIMKARVDDCKVYHGENAWDPELAPCTKFWVNPFSVSRF